MAIVEFSNNQAPYLSAENLNEIQKGNIYSTNEIVVGKWLNNKPIYRKVVRFNPRTDNMETTFAHGISNVEEILPSSSCLLHRINNQYVLVSMTYPANTASELLEWSCGWQITLENIVMWIGSSMRAQLDTTNYGAIAILEYTKTTD